MLLYSLGFDSHVISQSSNLDLLHRFSFPLSCGIRGCAVRKGILRSSFTGSPFQPPDAVLEESVQHSFANQPDNQYLREVPELRSRFDLMCFFA